MPDLSEIFRSGTLEMSSGPIQALMPPAEWSDVLVNRIIIVVAVALVLLALKEIVSFVPDAWYCLKRARGSINLEHSISIARSRNIIALINVLPFCLLIDYFGIIRIPGLPAWLGAASVACVILAYLLLRRIAYALCKLRRKFGYEIAVAAHRVIFTFFIILTWVMLATLGVMHLFDVDAELIRNIVIIEIAALYFLSFIRTGQILTQKCSGISTILYLCALEILPTGLLVAGALIL